MPYFAVDDGLCDHPKVLEFGGHEHFREAMGLWVLAGSWCQKHLTDGALPSALVTKLGFDEAHASALVEGRFWKQTKTGFQFIDWAKRNGTKSQIQRKRADAKKRVTKHREKRARNALQEQPVTLPHPNPSQPIPTQDPPLPPEGECGSGFGSSDWDLAALGDAMRTRFKSRWLKARSVEPSMGGKNLGDFPARVLATSGAQRVEPLDLFDRVVSRMLSGQLDDVALRAPYATLSARWGELADPTGTQGSPMQSGTGMDPEERLTKAKANRAAQLARQRGGAPAPIGDLVAGMFDAK